MTLQQQIDALKHDIDNLNYVRTTIKNMDWRYKQPTIVLGVVSARILTHRAKIVKLLQQKQKGGE